MTFLFKSSQKVILVFAFFFFISNLDAQITLGVKGGYVKAWMEYGDVNLPDDAAIDVKGFNISLLSYLELNKYLDIGIEPGYVQRGAACIPGWSPIFAGDTRFRLNYVELPLMVRGNLAFAKDRLEVFGKIGYGGSVVQKGIEIATFFGGETSFRKTKIDFSEDRFSNLNRFDHGLYSSLGFGFNFGKNQLFVEGNYYHGLRDFDDNNTSKNRSLQLGLGVVRSFGF